VRLSSVEWHKQVNRCTIGLGVVAAAGMLACTAHAGFICRDPWHNTYRLPLAPTGLSCELAAPAVNDTLLDQVPPAPTALGALKLKATNAPVSGGLLLRLSPVSSTSERRHNGALDALIAAAAARYGHPTNLLRAIVHVESRFNTAAVSPKGAIGLMQVMPATATGLGVVDPATRLFDPAVNLDAGARLLRQLLDQFKDRPELAIAAYNAGPGAVLKHGRGIPPYPETQAYVRDVTAEYTRLTR
jgi:soluble lytic murein transglycosylase-like protein